MDYSVLLETISNNQVQILNLLSNIKDLLGILCFMSCLIFLYFFIMNLFKRG